MIQEVLETVNVIMPTMESHVLTSQSLKGDFSCNYSGSNFPTCRVISYSRVCMV